MVRGKLRALTVIPGKVESRESFVVRGNRFWLTHKLDEKGNRQYHIEPAEDTKRRFDEVLHLPQIVMDYTLPPEFFKNYKATDETYDYMYDELVDAYITALEGTLLRYSDV